MRWRRNSMKYILYVLSFFCLLIGGGAWFFYNHPVGVIGVILSLYILYRLERQPHKLSLKWPGSKGKGASRDQAAFEKAVSDFNRMEAERLGLTDPDLRRTVANMQHIARNFLYYLQQYPERIGLAEHFIDYYQDRAVYMVHKYKKLAEAAIQITTKKGVGSTPNCWDMANASGKAKAAAALFVISSVNRLVIINKIANKT